MPEDLSLEIHPASPESSDPDQSQPATIATDTPCLQCGYNLRGLQPNSNCPECGLSVAESLTRNSLQGVFVRWFTALRIGIVIYMASIAIYTSWEIVAVAIRNWTTRRDACYTLLFWPDLAVNVATVILQWWAIQLLAQEPDPSRVLPQSVKLRQKARLANNVVLLFYLFEQLIVLAPFPLHQMLNSPIYSAVVQIALPLLDAWLLWTLFTMLADTARRITLHSIAAHASILRWIFLISQLIFAAGPVLRRCLQIFEFDAYTLNHILVVALEVPTAVVGLIASIWATVIFVRIFLKLGHYRAFAAPDPAGSRSAWIPEQAASLVNLIKRACASAAYHGTPPD